jgi:glycosyltransferase involved in cell wall biosynthesis
VTVNVLALYADQSGCGDYRVRFPAGAVNADPDLGVKVRTADHLDADAIYEGPRMRIRRIDLPYGTRVVSFQRPTKGSLVGAMKWLRERRPDVGLVVELDDDLMSLPAQHEAFGQLNPRISPTENTTWLRHALNLADAVTVSTPELAKRYGGNRPTFVVRNGVPPLMLSQCPSRALSHNGKDRDRIIGWAGYTGTHPGDLEVTSGAVADVMADRTQGREVRFRNIGPRDGLCKALDLPPEMTDQVEASGWLDPTMYRIALASLDIGIVPLQDTAFNRAKSTLKALEFAAAGVPVIASDLPEFAALRDAGLPIQLVKPRRKDWTTALTRILSLSDDALYSVAYAHRQWAREHAVVDERASEWAHAWLYAASVAQRRSNGAARVAS